jgi:hypothetical protein
MHSHPQLAATQLAWHGAKHNVFAPHLWKHVDVHSETHSATTCEVCTHSKTSRTRAAMVAVFSAAAREAIEIDRCGYLASSII